MVYLSGKEKFVPVGEIVMMVNGLQNSLYHDIKMEHWQYMPIRKAFLDVLREEHRIIVFSEDEEFKSGMEKSKYFTISVLAEMYSFLEYLVGSDHQIPVGEYCCTFGTQGESNYVVKVGEAVCESQNGEGKIWREGIYRISTVEPPEKKG